MRKDIQLIIDVNEAIDNLCDLLNKIRNREMDVAVQHLNKVKDWAIKAIILEYKRNGGEF